MCCSNLCCAAQAAHTFCASVLCVHVVYYDKHVLSIYMFTPDKLINIYIYYYYFNAHYLLVSRFTDVHFNMNCMNVHVLNIL